MLSKRVLTVLGGGSVWTPYLIQQLAMNTCINNWQIRLLGTDFSHLNEVMAFSRRFIEDTPEIQVTVDVAEAVYGASIILNQVRIGGWAARLDDETFPVQMGGIGDESLGAGGLRAFIRTWPFVRKVSRIILQYAPDAWMLNLTNPSDLISRAWYKSGCHRIISLCDYPQTLAHEMAELAERPEASIDFGFIGITHVGWLIPPPGLDLRPLLEKHPELRSWESEWGALPTLWRMRMDNQSSLVDEHQLNPGVRSRQLIKLVELMRDAIRSKEQEKYCLLLEKRKLPWYSEVVVPTIRALQGGARERLIVGLPNNGRLPGVADDVFWENWAVIDRDFVNPEPITENARCRQDIVYYSDCRDSAFEVIMNLNRPSLTSFARSDPFTRIIIEKGNLERLVEFLINTTNIYLDIK